jgi:hypothetical protein
MSKGLILLDTNNFFDKITYDTIMDLLIKGQKLRNKYPKKDIYCVLQSSILEQIPESYRILSGIYDRVIKNNADLNNLKETKRYHSIKKIPMTHGITKDNQFDTDYDYHQVKTILGPHNRDLFMFKERDLEIKQKGGFDFNKKKIKYTHIIFDPKSDTVCNLYGLNEKTNENESPINTSNDKLNEVIKDYHLTYYHTNKNTQYRPFNVVSMFDNIEEFDYVTPLKKLKDCMNDSNYYNQLHSKYSSKLKEAFSSKIRLNLVDDIDIEDREAIMIQYIKCREKTRIVTLFGSALRSLNEITELLEEFGKIYYIKTINLNKHGMRNLMFWHHDDFSYDERLVFIEKKLSSIDVVDDNNSVCIIIFDDVESKNAVIKQELKIKLMEILSLNEETIMDLFHINEYFYQTVEVVELLLNKNSVNMLNEQDCKMFASDKFSISNLKIQTLRKLIYSNMSLLEIDRLLLMNDVVLYAYGIRPFESIDTMMIGTKENDSKMLTDYFSKFFCNKESKLFFLNGGYCSKNEKKKSGQAKYTTKDLVLDPVNFFYFQGIKIIRFSLEMVNKIIRNSTEDQVDFMMMNFLPKLNDKLIPFIEANIEVPTTNFFIINQKYEDIFSNDNNDNSDDTFENRMKILMKYYSKEQIDESMQNNNNLKILKNFFGNSFGNHELPNPNTECDET